MIDNGYVVMLDYFPPQTHSGRDVALGTGLFIGTYLFFLLGSRPVARTGQPLRGDLGR